MRWMRVMLIASACSAPRPSVHLLEPDAGPADAPIDAGSCNVVAQTCAPGEKCTWIIDPADPTTAGHADCAPSGLSPLGGRCAIGALGYDDCVSGAICQYGRCVQICDHASPTSCGPTAVCTYDATLFDVDGVRLAGVCITP